MALEQAATRPGTGVMDTGNAYRGYVLVILTLVYAVNFMDRYALVAMAEHIRLDLGLTDGQIGLLTGFAFSLLYAVVGFPMAFIADRVGHVRVIAASIALWSFMTMLGGRATGFLTLAATRVGVGIGEAGGTPPAHAILSGTFSARALPGAMSIFSCGSGIGLTLGLVLGGVLATEFGWRMALVLLGIPGLLLAPVVYFTLRNPTQPAHGAMSLAAARSALGRVFRDSKIVMLALSMSVAGFAGFANLVWLPSLHLRRFGLEAGTGVDLGFALGLANVIGILVGGPLCAFLEQRTRITPYWLCSFAALASLPLFAIAGVADTSMLFSVAAALGLFAHSLLIAPVMTQMQRLAGVQDKALASALLLFGIAVIGSGAGPYVAGWISDRYAELGTDASLTWGLQCTLLAYVAAVVLFLRAGQVGRSIATSSSVGTVRGETP
ncbi:MAG: MFS transporter [Pseudomonadales bacterium]